MRRAAFLRGAAACLALFAVSGASSSGAMLDLRQYRISFDDEFTTLDVSAHGPGTRWTPHTPWHGDFGDAVFDDPGPNGPLTIGADGLTITARKDTRGVWHSGLLSSMDRDGPMQHGFAQRYGYFEMMAKLPSGPGTWPAFWLVGTDKRKSAAEIDVIEYYGAFDRYFHSTEHVWLQGKDIRQLTHMQQVPGGLLSNQFNSFGVLIEPRQTSFYLNRQQIWSTATPPEYRQPMYILADLALGGGWPITHLSSPQVMQIRYIRAYQADPVGAGG